MAEPMSEPKRYTGKCEAQSLGSPHWEHPEGEWVKWEDYARLKAEVERLRALSFVTAVPVEQYERLRKAGDNLARAIDDNGCHDNGDWYDQQNAIYDWNAAKDGKPSA